MHDTPNATPMMSKSYPSRPSAANFYQAKPIGFADVSRGIPSDIGMIIWASHSRDLPAESRKEEVVKEILEYLARGGTLFLVGFAQRYVVDLGIETTPPDRYDFLRVNHNDASPAGSYFITGFHTDEPGPLVKGVRETERGSGDYPIGAGAAMILETCGWENDAPESAKTLATYMHIDEKGVRLSDSALRILNIWNVGSGKVLGYGNNIFLDECWYNPNRENLEVFLTNVRDFLAGNSAEIAALPETPGALHADDFTQLPAFPERQPHSLDRRFPGIPYISHWGWHGVINYQRSGKETVDIDYYRERLIDEPFRWGANLLEFYPPDMDHGFPFAWAEDDPIPVPREPLYYWGGDFDPNWSLEQAREVFRLAHRRDMSVQVFYHPDLVWRRKGTSEGDIVEAGLNATEFQARELQNPLLYGRESSHDGAGVEWWGNGRNGEFTERIWNYNPGSYQYSTALLPATTPNFAGAWMCAFGRSASINACGFGEHWRYVFHPPLFLSYQADCRSRKPSTRDWGGWANYGGGSTPDWILAQACYFARDRLYLDSSLWWLGEPESTMLEQDRQYVYAISSDPLRCAVTSDMRAIGSNGYRARAAETAQAIHPNYSCAEVYPCDTAFIQNNYFRLLRNAETDGGVLEYDPTRLAHFSQTRRPNPVAVLSDTFLTAVPLGARIDSPRATATGERAVCAVFETADLSPEHPDTKSYSRRVVIDAGNPELPGYIAYEMWPRYPQEIEIDFEADAGRYEVEVIYESTPCTSTIEVEIDGRIAGYYFAASGSKGHDTISFGITRPGKHELVLKVQRSLDDKSLVGDAVHRNHRLSSVTIFKTGNEGITHRYPTPAGYVARCEETVTKDAEARYRQTRTYTVSSDTPVLRIDISSEAPAPTAWELYLSLPNHGDPEAIRGGGYRIQSHSPDVPALCLFMPGTTTCSVTKRDDTVVIAIPSAERSDVTLGFLIDDGLYSDFGAVRDTLFDPPEMIELGDGVSEYTNDSDIPRCRIIEIPNPSGLPYHVSEENADGERFWYTRGAQVQPDHDLLKLYLQPRSTAKIATYDFIDGEVKAGYGCQYMLAIRDNIHRGFCEVEVIKTGPFVFAPRLEWSRPFDTVRVNGEVWRYFDGPIVYLPNRPGRYTVEVERLGIEAPTLGRTFLCVDRAVWNAENLELELDTRAPQWWEGPLPGDIAYTAHILTRSYRPVEVTGDGSIVPESDYRALPGQIEAMRSNGSVVRLKPGKASIRFRSK